MQYHESKTAIADKKLILKSYPKNIQSKLLYLVNDILEDPQSLDAIGNPEELKHKTTPTFSRELTKKDRIVFEIKPGINYGMPKEKEIVVFLQYLGHYKDK